MRPRGERVHGSGRGAAAAVGANAAPDAVGVGVTRAGRSAVFAFVAAAAPVEEPRADAAALRREEEGENISDERSKSFAFEWEESDKANKISGTIAGEKRKLFC